MLKGLFKKAALLSAVVLVGSISAGTLSKVVKVAGGTLTGATLGGITGASCQFGKDELKKIFSGDEKAQTLKDLLQLIIKHNNSGWKNGRNYGLAAGTLAGGLLGGYLAYKEVDKKAIVAETENLQDEPAEEEIIIIEEEEPTVTQTTQRVVVSTSDVQAELAKLLKEVESKPVTTTISTSTPVTTTPARSHVVNSTSCGIPYQRSTYKR